MTFLNDVECSGLEERLEHCNHSGIRLQECDHQEDIGVTCGVGTCNKMNCMAMYMFMKCIPLITTKLEHLQLI